ncbi:MAG: sulfotransferase domain-containing protein [Deltaproteobacteria bacterium]|nr:sulfotransferase domain-containing protein [Deltaproteobacteria bacterium]
MFSIFFNRFYTFINNLAVWRRPCEGPSEDPEDRSSSTSAFKEPEPENAAPTPAAPSDVHVSQESSPRSFDSTILFVSLPKSGTVFTIDNLAMMTGSKNLTQEVSENDPEWNKYIAGFEYAATHHYLTGEFTSIFLLPQQLQSYLGKRYIIHAHMPASIHNTETLTQLGVRKLTILLRDPRDACVSWAYYLQANGATGRDFFSKFYHIPSEYFVWSFQRQLSYQVRTFLPLAVNWIESWLSYYSNPARTIDTLLVYFDELKRRPLDYFRKITEFHGALNVNFESYLPPEEGQRNFRRGRHHQWQDEFTSQDKAFCHALIGNRLSEAMRSAAMTHPAWPASLESRPERYADAAALLLSLLDQFPNFIEGYLRFFELLRRSGASIDESIQARALQVVTASQGTPFMYHDEVLALCHGLVEKHCPTTQPCESDIMKPEV